MQELSCGCWLACSKVCWLRCRSLHDGVAVYHTCVIHHRRLLLARVGKAVSITAGVPIHAVMGTMLCLIAGPFHACWCSNNILTNKTHDKRNAKLQFPLNMAR